MMSIDGRVYVSDSLQCRIRTITAAKDVATRLSCSTRAVDILRPEGCSMYDPAVDNIDRKATPVTNNVYYNYQDPKRGYSIPRCQGFPPPDLGLTSARFSNGPQLYVYPPPHDVEGLGGGGCNS